MTYIFIAAGLVIGFLQYALLKTLVNYMTEKKGAAGVAVIKVALYAVVAAVLLLWFKEYWMYCLAGVGAGILLTAALDLWRNKKK